MGCNGGMNVPVFRNLFLSVTAPFLAAMNGCAIALIGNTVTFSGTIVNMQGVGATVTFFLQVSFDGGNSWESLNNFVLGAPPSYNRVVQLGMAAPLFRLSVLLQGPAGTTALVNADAATNTL